MTEPGEGRVEWLTIAGDRARWRTIGLTVGADGLVPFLFSSLRIVDGEHGIRGWALSGIDSTIHEIDGLPTTVVDVSPPAIAQHANGAVELDHVVVLTGSLDRTCGAIADATGAPLKRIRELATYSDPEFAPLDINGAIDETLHLLRRELSLQRVSLRLDLAPGLPPVLGDRVQLQQVVINLVMNGVESMAKVSERPHTLTIKSRQHEAGQILVAVRDTGVGIDPESADRLFVAFFTTKPGGMGMGLSICRSIIEDHDGKLWASGDDGPGATFQFTVPVHRVSA